MYTYERLKSFRKDILKLSQTEFGERLGVTRAVIKNMELGTVELKEPMIKLACAEFNLNEHWLRTGEGNMYKTDNQDDIAKLTKMLLKEEDDSFKNRLISVLANMSEDEWKLLADVAERLNNYNQNKKG